MNGDDLFLVVAFTSGFWFLLAAGAFFVEVVLPWLIGRWRAFRTAKQE